MPSNKNQSSEVIKKSKNTSKTAQKPSQTTKKDIIVEEQLDEPQANDNTQTEVEQQQQQQQQGPKTGDFLKMIPTLIGIFLIQKLDMKDPSTIFYIYLGYAIVQLVTFSVLIYIYVSIYLAPKQKEKIEVKEAAGWGASKKTVTLMTRNEYDLAELIKFVKSTLIMMAITIFISYKWEIMPPLLMQALMGLGSLYSQPLIKSYIFNQKLDRPFPAEGGGLAAWLEEKMKPAEEEAKEDSTDSTDSTKIKDE